MHYPKHPIGLLGGTFDPIHIGHLAIAEAMINEFDLQSVHFIPSKKPPHRPAPMASAKDRLAMVRLATAQHPQMIANDIELSRATPSYTVDTLKTLRSLIPEQPLCLLLGEDVFASLNQWLHWNKILDYTHIISIARTGFMLPQEPWLVNLLADHQTKNTDDLHTLIAGKILLSKTPYVSLSATQVREKLMNGNDVSSDLPKEVLRYIQQHHLYQR